MSSLLQAYLQQFKLKDTADGSFAAVTSAAAAAAADAETVVVGTRSLPVEHCSTVRNPENQSDNGDVEWTDEQLKQMFLYRVPVTTDDGSCSASKEVAPEPASVAKLKAKDKRKLVAAPPGAKVKRKPGRPGKATA